MTKLVLLSVWAVFAYSLPLVGFAGPSPSSIHLECYAPGHEFEGVDRISDLDPPQKVSCGGSKTGASAFPTHALKFAVDSRASAHKGGTSVSQTINGDTLYFNVHGATDDSETKIRFRYFLASQGTLWSGSTTNFMLGLPSYLAGVDYAALGIAEPYNTQAILQNWSKNCEELGLCAPLSDYPFELELTIYGRSAVVPIIITIAATANSKNVDNKKYSVEDTQVNAHMNIYLPRGVDCYSRSGSLFSYKCPPIP